MVLTLRCELGVLRNVESVARFYNQEAEKGE